MTVRRPEGEHLTPDPLRELLGSDEIQQPRGAFRARLRSNLVTAPPTPTGWSFKLPSGQRLAPATSAMAMVLLVSLTALAAFFFTDTVLPTGLPEVDVDAPVLVEPEREAPLEGAPGGPGLDAETDAGAALKGQGASGDSELSEDGASGDINAPLSPPKSAPRNNPGVAPVAPSSTPEAPAPPAEEPEEPKEPRRQPTDEPEAPAPQPTPTDFIAPGRDTRPPLPTPTETPTEAPAPILPIAPHSAG